VENKEGIMQDDRLWGNLGFIAFGLLSSVFTLSTYSKISRLEKYGGSVLVNPTTKWIYDVGGKNWVLGIGLTIGIGCILIGIIRLLADTSSPKLLTLSRKGWKDSRPSVRQAAIAGLSDPDILEDIAKNDPILWVRIAAAEKIDNQTILADIAKSDSDERVRLAAAEKVGNQALLGDIVKNEPSLYVSLVLIERISDRTVLADIAENASVERVRQVAAEKVAVSTG
jgi:hypothetical protein